MFPDPLGLDDHASAHDVQSAGKSEQRRHFRLRALTDFTIKRLNSSLTSVVIATGRHPRFVDPSTGATAGWRR